MGQGPQQVSDEWALMANAGGLREVQVAHVAEWRQRQLQGGTDEKSQQEEWPWSSTPTSPAKPWEYQRACHLVPTPCDWRWAGKRCKISLMVSPLTLHPKKWKHCLTYQLSVLFSSKFLVSKQVEEEWWPTNTWSSWLTVEAWMLSSLHQHSRSFTAYRKVRKVEEVDWPLHAPFLVSAFGWWRAGY